LRQGRRLSEHSAPFDALVQVFDGEGVFTVGGKVFNVVAGELLIMPADVPHRRRGEELFQNASYDDLSQIV